MLLGTRRRVAAAVATMGAALALALTLSGRGCAEPDASPDGAVRAFVAAVQTGNKQAAWDLLGPATRGQLEQHAISATQKVGGARRYRAIDMLEVSAVGQQQQQNAGAAIDVQVVERTDGAAVVEISGPEGRTDRVRAVRVGSRWRVELD